MLIIESNQRLAWSLSQALSERPHCAVDTVMELELGLRLSEINAYDLILVGLTAAHPQYVSAVQALRAAQRATPILTMIATEDKPLTIKLLDAGADDCLPKPFDRRELIARADTLMRRAQSGASRKL